MGWCKPALEDLAVQLESTKTTIMIIMIITLLDFNRLEARKMNKMLKGRQMATVREAVKDRLDRDR